MAETYSQLMYRQIEPTESSATTTKTVIALHGHQGWIDDLVPLATSIGPDVRVVAVEAARGVYFGTKMISKTWFGGTLERPEAASFGDSLAQLERFIYDVCERIGEGAPRPFLLGYRQGAVLALSIAYIAPDLVSGVLAIDGGLPHFTSPGLLESMEGSLPILLVGHGDGSDATYIANTVAQFQDLGHRVTVRQLDAASEPGPDIGHELRTWMNEVRFA